MTAIQPPTTPSDVSLLAGVARGDESAMASLYDAHSAIVYSIAFRILQDAASAENVLQDIFLAIWRDPASFVTARDKLKVWLGIVARARAVTLLRMRRDKCSTGVIPLGGPDTLPTHVEGQLTVEQARMSAARIPNDEREVLEMAFFEDLTCTQIAEKRNIPNGRVKIMLRDALRSLRDPLKQ